MKYFSLRIIFRLTQARKPTFRKTAMKLHLNQLSSVGTMTSYGLKNHGSISDTEVCELYGLCWP
jgi:hypothetical protein